MKKRSTSFCLAGLALLLLSLSAGHAYAGDSKEYLIKAAFIYNFVKFVEWPADKAISKQSNIDICVLGASPMSDTSPVFKKASTDKLKLSLVNESSAASAASHCHVVFIASGSDVGAAKTAFQGKPVLTVSDSEGFAESGGMIGFVVADNKIKIEVNPKAASAAGLRVDAQLLEIALKVIR